MQYFHRISTQIEKRNFLTHCKIRLVWSLSSFNIGKLFPYEDRQFVLHSVGLVYLSVDMQLRSKICRSD